MIRVSLILCFFSWVTMADNPYELRLGGRTFDPLKASPMETVTPWDEALPEDSMELRLIQFFGPTKDTFIHQLNIEGIRIVQYIHPYTYIVWADRSSLQNVESLSFVRWTGDFKRAYRVLPRWREMTEVKIPVKILYYVGGSRSGLVQSLNSLGESVSAPKELTKTLGLISLNLDGEAFLDASMTPEVYSIQPIPTDGGDRGEVSSQINVGNVNASGIAFPGYHAWLTGAGLDGSGVIIANVDSGIDQNHTDLANQMLPCSGDTCGGTTSSSHGTHTAGIMVGNGISGITDALGFLRGLGVAPGAGLVEQLYSPTYSTPGGMLKLMADSFNNGASLSGNSWGPAGSPTGYDNDTLQVDIGVRDVDSLLTGNQPLTYVLSIMNGYGGTSSQGSPDEAKNIFTIGSTVAQTSGQQSGAIQNLSSNSAHGPCKDGRIIPHMVAPGCSVDSTLPGNTFGFKCGTSMASPQVSGAVALFIEYYRNLFGTSRPDPSPALVKAAFLSEALNLIGANDADGQVMGQPFNSKYGWGRLNLPSVVQPQVDILYFDQDHVFTDSNEEWTQEFIIPDIQQDVRIMLAWTDAPGHGLGGNTPAWNNDLNLEVTVDGNIYNGNAIGTDGFSVTGFPFDQKNNTEGVFFHVSPGVDSFVVRVIASNINSDGLPGNADITDQDFALVISNATVSAPVCAGVIVEATAPEPFMVCQNSAFSLSLLGISGGTPPYHYAWTPSDLLVDPNQAEPVATILTDTLFNVVITDDKGCSGQSEIQVIVHQTGTNAYIQNWRNGVPSPQVIDRNSNGLFDILDLLELGNMCVAP